MRAKGERTLGLALEVLLQGLRKELGNVELGEVGGVGGEKGKVLE